MSVVTLRPWRREDLAAMAEIINAQVIAEGDGEPVTEASLAESYDHLQRCDPLTDIIVAEDARGDVAGYARTTWNDIRTGIREYVVVFEARAGLYALQRTLFDWAVERATENAAAHDHDDKRLKAFATVGGTRHELLVDAGFTPTGFSATMVRSTRDDVPDRPLPAGLTTRPVSGADLRAIWEADVEAFADDDNFVEQDEDDWARFVDEASAGTALWTVAWDGDDVVGQVRTRVRDGEAARIGRQRAWTEEISTRRDWRKRGVATALITASLRQLTELGFDEAALTADTESAAGSFHLYESLGYREVIRPAMMSRPL